MPTLVGILALARADGAVPTRVGTCQSDATWHPVPGCYFAGASAVCAATMACCISFSDR